MKKILIIALPLLFLIGTVYFINFYENFHGEIFGSPDIVMNQLASNQFSLIYSNPLFPSGEIIGGYGFIKLGKGLAPTSMIGYPIILIIFKGISPYLVYLVNPLFQILTLIVFFVLCLNFMKKGIAVAVTFLFAMSNISLYNSALMYNNVVLNFFFILSIYLFVLGHKKENVLFFALSGLFIGVSFFIAYNYFIFSIILCLFCFKEKKWLKSLVYFSIPILILLFTLLISFYVTYGSVYGQFGANKILVNSEKSPVDASLGIYQFLKFESFNIFYQNIEKIIIPTNPLVIITFLWLLFYVIYIKDKEKRFLLILILIISITILMYYAGWRWFGFGSEIFGINNSYSRYLFPFWTILFITLGIFLEIKRNKLLIPILIMVILCTNILSFYIGPTGYMELQDYKTLFQTHRDTVLLDTPNNSVIFTKSNDKFFIPFRTPAIYVSLPLENQTAQTYIIIQDLLNHNISVFWENEGASEKYGSLAQETYFDYFSNKGLQILKTDSYLNQITLKNETTN